MMTHPRSRCWVHGRSCYCYATRVPFEAEVRLCQLVKGFLHRHRFRVSRRLSRVDVGVLGLPVVWVSLLSSPERRCTQQRLIDGVFSTVQRFQDETFAASSTNLGYPGTCLQRVCHGLIMDVQAIKKFGLRQRAVTLIVDHHVRFHFGFWTSANVDVHEADLWAWFPSKGVPAYFGAFRCNIAHLPVLLKVSSIARLIFVCCLLPAMLLLIIDM